MKLLASLIIAASLVIGVTGAMTAYLAPLTLADERIAGLELNAPVGIHPEDLGVDPYKPGGRRPLATRSPRDTPPTIITPELLDQMREQDVSRVHVKEFQLWNWIRGGGMPLFFIGCVGLLGGAVLLRRANRALLMSAAAPRENLAGAAAAAATPDALFEAIRSGIHQLQRELSSLSDHDKLHAIMTTFGQAQRTHIPAFIATRQQLISRLGLAGYAQLMDSFSAAERQLNRAWSAAADNVLDEALHRVDMAAMLMEEAAAKLH